MNQLYFVFAIASFALVMGSWTQYLSTVPRMQVPVWPTGSVIIQGLAFLLGIAALATLSFNQPVWPIVSIVLALFGMMMAAFFYWLLFTQRKTPIGDIRVEVGDQILPFTALTADGSPFSSDELLGQRVLFKFFRGGW